MAQGQTALTSFKIDKAGEVTFNLIKCLMSGVNGIGKPAGLAWLFFPLGLLGGQLDPWSPADNGQPLPSAQLEHPINGAVFPANMPAPVLFWRTNMEPGRWVAGFRVGERKWLYPDITQLWRPPEGDWQAMKSAATSLREEVEVALGRFEPGEANRIQARSSVRFAVSAELVEQPVFFREVNLPFSEAVKDPTLIRWRFGGIDLGRPPPIVLERLPVCGNCHSFSRDGKWLAMDVDYANSKASYIVTATGPEMKLHTSDIISWDEYRRGDGLQTFGLLSQISPDGQHVLSTVKDRSVFVPRPNLAFSQLFFPLKGIIAVLDRQAREITSLPGADDPAFVQSNPTWSPDGKFVLFVRTKAAELEASRDPGRVLLTPDECEEFLKRGKEFRYDIYRVPFNEGKGGLTEPVKGASANKRSNYFPKYSPDGKWVVFCQASNYMLLQPDSELYIIPAEGGVARRLDCNLSRMNSWHSWTADGKWLIFSSKAHSDYTQLYLTRISEEGKASPPVWLAHLVEPGRAANIPEFVNLPKDQIRKINEQFLDDYSYTRAGNQFYQAGEPDKALEKYSVALSMNPNNAMAQQRTGFLLYRVKGQLDQASAHLRRAIELEPRNGFAQFDLGSLLAERGDVSNAVGHLREAVRLLPKGYDRQYNAVEMNYALGEVLYRLADYAQCTEALDQTLRRQPSHGQANFLMAMARARLGQTDEAVPFFNTAVQSVPKLGELPDFYELLSRNYAEQGKTAAALQTAQKAQSLAAKARRTEQAARLQERIEFLRSKLGQ